MKRLIGRQLSERIASSRAAQLASGLLVLAATLPATWGGFELLFPRNWIALFGDSYAKGNGDWLHEGDPWRNPPFGSAHLIHETLGADVMNFGVGGAGSAGSFLATRFTIALVPNLKARLRGHRSHEPKLSPPVYGAYNKAAIGGREVNLPLYLQGPALRRREEAAFEPRGSRADSSNPGPIAAADPLIAGRGQRRR